MLEGNKCLVDGVAQITCLEPMFGRVVEIITVFAGFVFLIMLVVGGLKYLFSAGNAKATESAKGTLTSAFLGLILIVAAYLIIKILSGFTGFNFSIFKIEQFK